MKKLLLLLFCFPVFGFSQMILDNQNKRNTFNDIQKSFELWAQQNNIDELKGWKWFKRWESHYGQRANPDGSLADPNIFLNTAISVINNKKSANKSATYLKSMLIESIRIIKFRRETMSFFSNSRKN